MRSITRRAGLRLPSTALGRRDTVAGPRAMAASRTNVRIWGDHYGTTDLRGVEDWIDDQLRGTSVTVVLVGKKTCDSKWVKYENEKSEERGNGLLGIDVSKIENLAGETTDRCGRIPHGYDFYLWNKDEGRLPSREELVGLPSAEIFENVR